MLCCDPQRKLEILAGLYAITKTRSRVKLTPLGHAAITSFKSSVTNGTQMMIDVMDNTVASIFL